MLSCRVCNEGQQDRCLGTRGWDCIASCSSDGAAAGQTLSGKPEANRLHREREVRCKPVAAAFRCRRACRLTVSPAQCFAGLPCGVSAPALRDQASVDRSRHTVIAHHWIAVIPVRGAATAV